MSAKKLDDLEVYNLWGHEGLEETRKKYIEKSPEDEDNAFLEFLADCQKKFTFYLECLKKKKNFEEKKAKPVENAVVLKAEAQHDDEKNSMKIDEQNKVSDESSEKKDVSAAVTAEKKPKNTAKRAKIEKPADVPLVRDMAGWHRVSMATDQKKQITVQKLVEYVKNPSRANYLLASIVASQLQENGPVFDEMCKEAFDEGAFCDNKGGDAIRQNLGAQKARQAYIDERTTEIKKKLLAEKSDLYGTSMESARLNIDAMEKLRKEMCRSVPFNAVAPYGIGDKKFQVYIIGYKATETDDVAVMSLPKNDHAKFFTIQERRAFVNSEFSDELDADGVAFMDLGANGLQILKDTKIDPKELYAAYMEGSADGVFGWFKKTLPDACDETKPDHLKAEHFQLSVVVKNLEKYKNPPSAKKGKAKQPKAKAKDAEVANEAKVALEGQRTIKQFATNVNKVAPKKVKVAQNAGMLVLDKSNEEFASMVEFVESYLKSTGFDEELAGKFPMKTQEDILSLVMPHTESKAANSMSKKNQKKGKKNANESDANDDAGAGAAAGGGAGEEDEQAIPEHARSQYQAYSAQIPKASRTLLMGNNLQHKLNNLTDDVTKPTTKAASDVKVQTNFARAAYLEKYGVDSAIVDGPTLAKTLDGVAENDPQSIVRLIVSKKTLERYVFRIAFDAQSRNEFKISEDNIAEFFANDKVCKFIADYLALDAMLGYCIVSYNTDGQKEAFEKAKKLTAKIDVGKGWF